MLNFVTMKDAKRAARIELVASETGLSEAIVEKDLWVCYLLDYLFHRSEFKDSIILGHSNVAERAIAQPGLLAKVVAFKEKFYRTPWSKLPDAKPGTLKLSPQPERLAELEADYDSMRPMIFGEVPPFEEIVAFMDELESRINGQ